MRKQAMIMAAVGMVAGAVPGAVEGQQARLAVQAGQASDESGATRTGLSVTPSFQWQDDEMALRVMGQGTLFREGGALGVAGVDMRAVGASLGPATLVLGAEAVAAASDAGHAVVSGALTPELRVVRSGWGVAAGPFLGSTAERLGERKPAAGTPLLPFWPEQKPAEAQTTRWRPVAGARAAAWMGSGPAALRVGWSGLGSEGVRWNDWTAEGTLDFGVAALGAEVGRRFAGQGEQWASATAAVTIAGPLTAVGRAGSYPSDPLTGRAGGRFASVGLALQVNGLTAR